VAPKLLSYGEVVCFASAWAVALLMAMSAERASDVQTARTFAVTADVSGMQATLSR